MEGELVREEVFPTKKGKLDLLWRETQNKLFSCQECGACVSVCTVMRLGKILGAGESFPRRIIEMVRLGMKKEVLLDKSIWLCRECNKCVEVCTQLIKPPDVFKALQEMVHDYLETIIFEEVHAPKL